MPREPAVNVLQNDLDTVPWRMWRFKGYNLALLLYQDGHVAGVRHPDQYRSLTGKHTYMVP